MGLMVLEVVVIPQQGCFFILLCRFLRHVFLQTVRKETKPENEDLNGFRALFPCIKVSIQLTLLLQLNRNVEELKLIYTNRALHTDSIVIQWYEVDPW